MIAPKGGERMELGSGDALEHAKVAFAADSASMVDGYGRSSKIDKQELKRDPLWWADPPKLRVSRRG